MATVQHTAASAAEIKLSPDERARLEAMSDADVNRAAESDPDNPPLDDSMLIKLRAARVAKSVRGKTGLSQAAFAEAFHIKVARLRDLEQGRVAPDPVLVSFLALIEDDPKRAAELVGKVHAAE